MRFLEFRQPTRQPTSPSQPGTWQAVVSEPPCDDDNDDHPCLAAYAGRRTMPDSDRTSGKAAKGGAARPGECLLRMATCSSLKEDAGEAWQSFSLGIHKFGR